MPEINGLSKQTLDLKEENTFLKERLRLLKIQIEEKRILSQRLRQEDDLLNRQNEELRNRMYMIEEQIRAKHSQTGQRLRPSRVSQRGRPAKVSRFEEAANIKTYLPRTSEKQLVTKYTSTEVYRGSAGIDTRYQNDSFIEPRRRASYDVQNSRTYISNSPERVGYTLGRTEIVSPPPATSSRIIT